MPILRIDVTVLCKADVIRMSMWLESTCAATGVESLKMLSLRSTRMAVVRFLVQMRAYKKTRPVGSISFCGSVVVVWMGLNW